MFEGIMEGSCVLVVGGLPAFVATFGCMHKFGHEIKDTL